MFVFSYVFVFIKTGWGVFKVYVIRYLDVNGYYDLGDRGVNEYQASSRRG